MISLQQLATVVPTLTVKLELIEKQMTEYRKTHSDYRAERLLSTVREKLASIRSSYKVFTTAPSFASKNFESIVQEWKKSVDDSLRLCNEILVEAKARDAERAAGKITLNDLDRIVPDIIARLDSIRRSMTRYKKRDTDYRANTLIREIEAKITQIRKVHDSYRAAPSFRDKKFDNWVNGLENYVTECKQIHDRIYAYEGVKGYS